MTPPRVTVIIPTYNWSTVLPYSIGSVLDQTFTDFELLVIGDGCTDDSERVVAEIPDPRVRWINIDRSGHQSGPNNEGLRQARGELIAYLGHDDLWLPHHLSALVAAIDAGHDLVHSLVALVPPEGAWEPATIAAPRWRPPSSVVHRRSVTDRVGGWGNYRALRVTPDGELWSRVEGAGYRIASVPQLTAIKFPASRRRHVYRERPSHEQAAWLEWIRTEADLEDVLFRRLREAGIVQRAWRLLRQPWRWLAFIRADDGANIRAIQRYKGVDHAAGRTERWTTRNE